jgi:hypothetical protein
VVVGATVGAEGQGQAQGIILAKLFGIAGRNGVSMARLHEVQQPLLGAARLREAVGASTASVAGCLGLGASATSALLHPAVVVAFSEPDTKPLLNSEITPSIT